MRRGLVMLLALVATGVPTGAAAAAKPLVTVCGKDSCVTTGRSNAVDNFFGQLLASHPSLEIHILIWDMAWLYAAQSGPIAAA